MHFPVEFSIKEKIHMYWYITLTFHIQKKYYDSYK